MNEQRKEIKLGRFPVPGCVLVMAAAVYSEFLLHLWVTSPVQPGRLVVVCAFALGFGAVLGFLTELIPSDLWRKVLSVLVSLVIQVVCLTEYFIFDAYKGFMSPNTIFAGAGGVAKDYLALVLSLLGRNLWRIVLMLLPTLCYCLLCRAGKTAWPARGVIALAAAAGYIGGFTAVMNWTMDDDKFTAAYEFNSSVQCFGLNVALFQEMTQSGTATEELLTPEVQPQLQAPEPTHSTQPEEETTASSEPTEPTYGVNVIEELDFEALAAQERNSSIAAIHSYVAAQTPSSQNAYTGLFQGKNLILISAESFTREVIDPELTPTLYRMATKGIQFTDYYQPAWGASTTSGEFSNLTGLVPTNGGMCMNSCKRQDLFLMMGKQLGRLGYHGMAYHNNDYTFYNRNETHTCLGYDGFVGLYGGMEGVDNVWPASDLQMLESTMPDYIDNQPFSVYYMTVSGHCMYNLKENAMARKNYDKVADLNHSEQVKSYLAANLELEYAMEALVKELEEKGIADDTVIAISSDHYPYSLERSGTWKNSANCLLDLYGVEKTDVFIRDHNALIIWSGCLEDKQIVVDEPVYSLDLLPTLSNLFGVSYDSRLLVGRDVFSDIPALVLWPDYSWKTELGSYNAKEKTFTPAPGAQIPEGYVEAVRDRVSKKIAYSRSVLDKDYFNTLSRILYQS